MEDIYNDLIMEHSMNSYNKKKLNDSDYEELGHNPNCGDEITLEVKLDGDRIYDMAFSRSWVCYITGFNFNYDRYFKRKNNY